MRVRHIKTGPCNIVGRDVHIWTVWIEPASSVAARFEPLLTPAEKQRSAQFRFDHLRYSFLITRGVLRVLLASYLRTFPAEIEFQYGPRGKPLLSPAAPLQFNASHSGSLAVFAFTTACDLGVDVEHVRSQPDLDHIAQRFFCAEESAELKSLPAYQRERAFYLCWTRKEAYIKATGDGLSVPLDDFRVTLHPGQPARFLHFAQGPAVPESWTLHDLPYAPEYAGALAYCDRERPVILLPVIDPLELLKIRS